MLPGGATGARRAGRSAGAAQGRARGGTLRDRRWHCARIRTDSVAQSLRQTAARFGKNSETSGGLPFTVRPPRHPAAGPSRVSAPHSGQACRTSVSHPPRAVNPAVPVSSGAGRDNGAGPSQERPNPRTRRRAEVPLRIRRIPRSRIRSPGFHPPPRSVGMRTPTTHSRKILMVPHCVPVPPPTLRLHARVPPRARTRKTPHLMRVFSPPRHRSRPSGGRSPPLSEERAGRGPGGGPGASGGAAADCGAEGRGSWICKSCCRIGEGDEARDGCPEGSPEPDHPPRRWGTGRRRCALRATLPGGFWTRAAQGRC
jgi:hypothetical protein